MAAKAVRDGSSKLENETVSGGLEKKGERRQEKWKEDRTERQENASSTKKRKPVATSGKGGSQKGRCGGQGKGELTGSWKSGRKRKYGSKKGKRGSREDGRL